VRNDGPSNPFELLEPPRGGLALLRARIERDSRRRFRLRWMSAIAATAGVLVLIVVITRLETRPAQPPKPDPFLLARVQLGLTPAPEEPVTVPAEYRHRTAVRRMAVRSDEVVFYQVASLADKEGPAAAGGR
jgi:hypothetical protein